jgi:hypothetical protein
MSDRAAPARRLSDDEVGALRFAANRQLARYASKPQLSEHQRAQRTALRRAFRVLRDDALTHGFELRPQRTQGDR